MKISDTPIPDLKVFTPALHLDERGLFYESFNQKLFNHLIGMEINFVQDNHSMSYKNVLRGLHYQIYKPQGKLIRVVNGEIYDVAVDLRKSSDTFGNWFGIILSKENKKQIYIPPGFAHGFVVISNFAEVNYKTTDYYFSEHERAIIWNDEDLQINWPISEPIISIKDSNGKKFLESEHFN